MLFRFGFALVRQAARALPLCAGYGLARLGGSLHYHSAPRRRAVLRMNLGAASRFAGRPAGPLAVERLVRAAFDHHAAFIFEWLRATSGGQFDLELTGHEAIE